MQRTFSAVLFNDVANRPHVRPTMGGSGEIDLTHVINLPGNFAYTDGLGGFFFQRLFDGYYEVHTIYDPNETFRRPKALVHGAKAVVERMFLETDAVELATKVLPHSEGASWLSDIVGFSESWTKEGVSYRNLTLDAWARSCSTLEHRGRVFHEQLEAAKNAANSKLPTHHDDAVHDRMVGVAIAMVTAGNVAKGVDTYNKWAMFAGYAPVMMISAQPPVIDVVDAVVGFHNGEMEIALCR